MREISLTQNRVAIVDDGDFDQVNQFKWYAHCTEGRYWYAKMGIIKDDGKASAMFMHRFILRAPPEKMVDHINGDGLYNLRSNLRLCTTSQNHQNQHRIRGRSRYKGVTLRRNKFRAAIVVCKKNIHLGVYQTEIEAAQAYDVAAIKYFGEFARTNASIFVSGLAGGYTPRSANN